VLLDVFYLLTILTAPPRLLRVMRKITSLYRYCRILFKAARSSRLSAGFERDFFIHAVPASAIPSNPRPPKTDDEWRRIRDGGICGLQDRLNAIVTVPKGLAAPP